MPLKKRPTFVDWWRASPTCHNSSVWLHERSFRIALPYFVLSCSSSGIDFNYWTEVSSRKDSIGKAVVIFKYCKRCSASEYCIQYFVPQTTTFALWRIGQGLLLKISQTYQTYCNWWRASEHQSIYDWSQQGLQYLYCCGYCSVWITAICCELQLVVKDTRSQNAGAPLIRVKINHWKPYSLTLLRETALCFILFIVSTEYVCRRSLTVTHI